MLRQVIYGSATSKYRGGAMRILGFRKRFSLPRLRDRTNCSKLLMVLRRSYDNERLALQSLHLIERRSWRRKVDAEGLSVSSLS